MKTNNYLITEQVRIEVLKRALRASSMGEVTRAIFDAIVDAGIDWRAVSVEEVKPVLVDAVRVFSGRTVQSGSPLAV